MSETDDYTKIQHGLFLSFSSLNISQLVWRCVTHVGVTPFCILMLYDTQKQNMSNGILKLAEIIEKIRKPFTLNLVCAINLWIRYVYQRLVKLLIMNIVMLDLIFSYKNRKTLWVHKVEGSYNKGTWAAHHRRFCKQQEHSCLANSAPGIDTKSSGTSKTINKIQ